MTLFNVSLCDCFLQYGEVTAEIAVLLAFVLFGVVLSRLLGTVALLPALALALLAWVAWRPSRCGIGAQGADDHTARALHRLVWAARAGLAPARAVVVRAHVPAAESLLAVTGVVVLVSVAMPRCIGYHRCRTGMAAVSPRPV